MKKIYDQYLAPSSPHTVNVDDRVLKAVEAKLSSPSYDIFVEAQEQVRALGREKERRWESRGRRRGRGGRERERERDAS